jgi:nuclear RNA export factor
MLRPDVLGKVKVANDMLVVRAYGGFDSWKPEDGSGSAGGGGEQEKGEAAKKSMCEQLMAQTRLRSDWATMCLSETGWNIESAWKAFLEAKANGAIPPDAYLPDSTTAPATAIGANTAGGRDGIL